MKKLKLFNTLSKEKEEIFPSNGKYITFYTCGPTVYDFAHIGNFRTYVFEDLLKRTLKFLGYEVLHVMNITDVDDKTIKQANSNNKSLKDYTKKFEKAFFEDSKILSLDSADYYPRATDYIDEMIKIIKDLLEKEIAYRKEDGSVYFSIKNFSSYGKLSGLKLEEKTFKRICSDEYDKENIADFALWKSYDAKRDGDIFWPSPFGNGRPGWHIECSAMAMKLLGKTIDIHAGGEDNIFPHHENEIAQSESFSNKTFVLHWAHAKHLIVDGKKMSKSFNNFYTLRDLLKKGYEAKEIRFLLLKTHYRKELNFTFESVVSAKASLQRIQDFILRLQNVEEKKENFNINPLIENFLNEFEDALIDDLNISKAFSIFFDFIKKINFLLDDNKIEKKASEYVLNTLFEVNKILKIMEFENFLKVPSNVKEALEKREKARSNKDWKEADEHRNFILSKGFIIEDTKKGPVLKKR